MRESRGADTDTVHGGRGHNGSDRGVGTGEDGGVGRSGRRKNGRRTDRNEVTKETDLL